MKSLGYPQFSVLGWCDGGVTAICLAAQFPDVIKKLVIWGSRTYLTKDDVKRSEELEDLKNWNPRFREAFEAIYGVPNLALLWQKFTDSVRALYAKTGGDVCTEEMSILSNSHPSWWEGYVYWGTERRMLIEAEMEVPIRDILTLTQMALEHQRYSH